MRADISRQTFDPSHHYRGVVTYQGRVILDADLNEQAAISGYHAETQTKEVIGLLGVPKGTTSFLVQPGAGFMTLGKGHMYVDGILCENDTDNLPIPNVGNLTDGRHLFYLDVWQRLVSAVDEPSIREKALGGPDTSGRIKVMWKVGVIRGGSGDTCATYTPGWAPPGASTGKLTASTSNPSTGSSNCVLPPEGGFTGLENQLYRVEIHNSGTRASGSATFKWSRENGSVAAGVSGYDGTSLVISDLGRDALLGFESAQWVEITDETHETAGQAGDLREIDLVDPASMTIRLKSATGTPAIINPTKVIRWEQSGPNGVTVAAGPIALENGIQVSFSDGMYNTGDYWLIPARTAVGKETSFIEWPQQGGAFQAMPRAGVEHHFAPLALLDLVGGVWTPVSDCRLQFPPLTAIAASDVSYDASACDDLARAETVQQAIDMLCARSEGEMCTFVVQPQPGWEKVFDQIGPGQSAEICFPVGDFSIDATKTVSGKGSLSLRGTGPGSRLIANKSESVLLFNGCANVSVHELYAQGGTAQVTSPKNLNGALSFKNCGAVTLDQVTLRCTGKRMETVSCVMVENDDQHAAGTVRILHCDMQVGNLQAGIIISNVSRAEVEDNQLWVEKLAGQEAVKSMLDDTRYLTMLSKALVSNIQPTSAVQQLGGMVNAKVTLGNNAVYFKTDPKLASEWQKVIDRVPPKKKMTSDIELGFYLGQVAEQIIKNQGVFATLTNFKDFFNGLVALNPAIATQGIVISGRVAEDVRVLNNTLRGFTQGIHVGTSINDNPPGTRLMAGTVRIQGNTITVTIPSPIKRQRHGIFVGNVNRLFVEDNAIDLLNPRRDVAVHAIRIFGQFGRTLIVRQNHLEGFTVGIYIQPLKNLQNPLGANTQAQWLVSDNMAPNASAPVKVQFDLVKQGPVDLGAKVRRLENYV